MFILIRKIMFTSENAQYIKSDGEQMSPITNIDSIYIEKSDVSDNSSDKTYTINRLSVAKRFPIQFVVDKNISDLSTTENNSEYEITDVDSRENEFYNAETDISAIKQIKSSSVGNDYISVTFDKKIVLSNLLNNLTTKQEANYVFSNIGDVTKDISISGIEKLEDLNSSVLNKIEILEPITENVVENCSIYQSEKIKELSLFYSYDEIKSLELKPGYSYNLIYNSSNNRNDKNNNWKPNVLNIASIAEIKPLFNAVKNELIKMAKPENINEKENILSDLVDNASSSLFPLENILASIGEPKKLISTINISIPKIINMLFTKTLCNSFLLSAP